MLVAVVFYCLSAEKNIKDGERKFFIELIKQLFTHIRRWSNAVAKMSNVLAYGLF